MLENFEIYINGGLYGTWNQDWIRQFNILHLEHHARSTIKLKSNKRTIVFCATPGLMTIGKNGTDIYVALSDGIQTHTILYYPIHPLESCKCPIMEEECCCGAN